MARRAEKKQATRDRIIAAAADLFCRQGYDATTVDDIVAIAGISQRSFFRYFPSKMHVAFPYNDEVLRRLEDLLERHRIPGAPFRGVRLALTEFGRWFGSMREEALREWQYVSSSPALLARDAETDRASEALVARELERGGLPRRRACLMAGVIQGGVRAVMQEWMADGCREEMLTVARDLSDLLEALEATMDAPAPAPAPVPASAPRARASRGA